VSSFGAWLRALFGRFGLALVLCVAVAAGSVLLVNHYIDEQVDDIPRVQLTTAPVGQNGMNFLIIGSDSRSWIENPLDFEAFSDDDTQNAPPRSDTMMVLHANGDNSFAVSFPRDLWVDIPGTGNAKMNAAFNDGPQKVIDTLQADFNVPVNHYLEVDFETFEGIVNAIGSVPVWIPGVVRDKFTGLHADWGAACYQLDGGTALQWVRARSLEIEDPNGKYDPTDGKRWKPLDATADIGRIERQQQFVQKLGRIAVQRALDDPMIVPDLVDALLPNLHADSGFDRGAFNELVRAFMGLASGGPGLSFETLPWEDPGRPVGGQSVLLVKQPEADTVFARLRGEIVVPPDSPETETAVEQASVRPSDVRVRVLNGSGVTGAAGDADQALSNLGYVSGGVSNYGGGKLARSEIHYRPGDEAKAQLLGAQIPEASLIADPSLGGGDVLLLIGTSFKGIGAKAPKDTAAPEAPVPTLSPEEACNQAT
jgi:LCP family protein required for cell wall assembly